MYRFGIKLSYSKNKQKIQIFQLESAGIKFNDLRGTGVSLRSQRMKLPANVGQKKTKALEQTLNEFKVGKRKNLNLKRPHAT